LKEDFYLYILFRETGIPFYVGKGRGDRWLQHEKDSIKLMSHKDRVIQKILVCLPEVPKIKIVEGLTNDLAKELEILFIAMIGREPDGPLINQTRGGDGCVEPSASMIDRIRKSLKGRKQNPGSAARGAASRRGRRMPLHVLEILVKRNTGAKRPLSTRLKQSQAKKGKPSSRQGIPLSEEHKERLRGPRGPCPNMRGPRGHWYHTSDGISYVAFMPRNPSDLRGR
jgi:hypothetical protein